MTIYIKLAPEYYCHPIWGDDDDVYGNGNIAPEELPISAELQKDLTRWAKAYDATLNQEYPPDTSGLSTETKRSLHEEGLRLQVGLQKQLGDDYYVDYHSPFPRPEE